MFALLARAKRLRGTWLDPFGAVGAPEDGASARRRVPRDDRDRARCIGRAERRPRTTSAYDLAVEIAGAVETIRGYETVKERNVERYRAGVGELLTELATR